MAGRPPLFKTNLTLRVKKETPDAIAKLAERMGYIFGDRGQAGALLDAIADLPPAKLRQLEKLLEKLLTT